MIRVEPAWGGPALAAQAIEQMYGRSHTRQQIYAWYKRRYFNGFPEKVNGQLPLEEVLRWYRDYSPRVGRPPKAGQNGHGP